MRYDDNTELHLNFIEYLQYHFVTHKLYLVCPNSFGSITIVQSAFDLTVLYAIYVRYVLNTVKYTEIF